MEIELPCEQAYSILKISAEDSGERMLAEQVIHQIGSAAISQRAIRVLTGKDEIPENFKPINSKELATIVLSQFGACSYSEEHKTGTKSSPLKSSFSCRPALRHISRHIKITPNFSTASSTV